MIDCRNVRPLCQEGQREKRGHLREITAFCVEIVIEVQTIFDPAGDHYQLVHTSWHKKLRQLVTVRWGAVKLTPTEYALLRLMIQHAGRVLTHRQILKEVWGPAYIEETHYLRVYFAQLRQKLEENPALPQLLITEPGVGYRLVINS